MYAITQTNAETASMSKFTSVSNIHQDMNTNDEDCIDTDIMTSC